MKKLILLNLMLLLMSWSINAQTATPPTTGNGSSGNPYQIANLENLYWISANRTEWTKYFIQTGDIDATATEGWSTGGWSPIGDKFENDGTGIHVFSGNYDGQGHTISGLHITNSPSLAFGLFGIARGAAIKNLGIINVDVSGVNASAGGLVGYAMGVTIYNCYSTGNLVGSSSVGGLVGVHAAVSTMFNCYSTCNVTGNSYTGGLVATNGSNSTITYSYHSTGTVTGSGAASCTGGLVGMNVGATISKCFSSGTVDGYNFTGGLAGYNESSAGINNCFSRSNCTSNPTYGTNTGGFVGLNNNNSNITNCYSTGSVQGIMGGFAGNQGGGATMNNSFWDTETSETSYSVGGTGKTTAEMKSQSTFTDWDFTTIWGINAGNNDGYPNFVCTDGTLALSSGSNTTDVCISTAIIPIVYNVGGGASGAAISPTLPNGLSGTYDSGGKTFTISGTPTSTGAYTYNITTTGTPWLCSEATATGMITVNPLPEVRITGNNSPICYDADAKFYLEGTPGAEVTYSFDGGTTTFTATLNGGTATVTFGEASKNVILSLTSIKNISTECIRALNNTSTVTVINTTVSISGANIACNSTLLTAVTNASSPTFNWGTLNDEGLWVLEGDGSTLVVTESGKYYLAVNDGVTGCNKLSDAFEVTFIPEPEISISGNNGPISEYENAEFYLEGTAGAEVKYSFDGGSSTFTATLNGGTATVTSMEASSDVTLSLISIKINSTGCIKALNSTSTVTVNSYTARISGAHIACTSTILTGETDASSPTYFWVTLNDEGWVLEGEGSTFEVTESGVYYLAVEYGTTGNYKISDPFEVTILDDTPPSISEIIANPAAMCTGGTSTLTVTGSLGGAAAWKWYSGSCGGTLAGTGTSITVSPTVTTIYYVRGEGGCATPGDCGLVIVTVETTPVAGALAKTPEVSGTCEGINVSAALTPGSGGNGTDELQFSTNDGTNWSEWAVYTSGTEISTTGKTGVEIRTRRLASCANSADYNTVTWEVEATPVAGTFAKTPDLATVCEGTDVSAVLTSGFGGDGTEGLWYRTKVGTQWSEFASYTSGATIGTTGKTAVEISTRRWANYCDASPENIANWVVEANPAPPVTGTITQPTCLVSTGSVVLSGLPSGNWKLTRLPDGTTVTGSGASFTVSLLAAGSYTFTVTNASGCISSASANVVINSFTALNVIASAGNIATYGGTTTLTATASGGTTPYRYSLNGGEYQSANTFTVSAGTYTVTVKDSRDCTATSSSVTVNQPAQGNTVTSLNYSGERSVHYFDQASFSATLRDNRYRGIKDKTITFKVGSQTITAQTNRDGVASARLIITQVPGSYRILTTFAGDATYRSSSDDESFTISKKSVTAGLTGIVSKIYDGTAIAYLSPANYTLKGVVNNDVVSLNNPPTGAYDNKNVGTRKVVTVKGLALTGSNAGNYSLGSTTVSASIGVITPIHKSASIVTDVQAIEGGFELMVYPNPFSERLRFEFVSPINADALLDIFDVTGRKVKTIFEGNVEGGVLYNAEFIPATSVTGLYFYRLTLGKKVFNGKVIYKE